MKKIAYVENYGVIKWSDGHGRWDPESNDVCDRGYWVKTPYGSPQYLSEDLEQVVLIVESHFNRAIRRSQGLMNSAVRKLTQFDEKNRMDVLDHIAGALDERKAH